MLNVRKNKLHPKGNEDYFVTPLIDFCLVLSINTPNSGVLMLNF